MRKAIYLFAIVVPVVLLTMCGTGCATRNYAIKCEPVKTYPTGAPLDTSVVLLLDKEFAGGVVYERPAILLTPAVRFTAPGSLDGSAEALIRALFSRVQVIKGPVKSVPTACDILIVPRITSGEEASDLGLVLFLEWTVTRPNGELVWKKTVKGQSAKGATMSSNFHNVLDDLFHRSYEQMAASPEIRAIAQHQTGAPLKTTN